MKVSIENLIWKAYDEQSKRFNISDLILKHRFKIDDYDLTNRQEIAGFFQFIEAKNLFARGSDQCFGYYQLFNLITNAQYERLSFISSLTKHRLLNLKAAFLDLINEPQGVVLKQEIIPFINPKLIKDSKAAINDLIVILNLDRLDLTTKLTYLAKTEFKLSKQLILKKIKQADVVNALIGKNDSYRAINFKQIIPKWYSQVQSQTTFQDNLQICKKNYQKRIIFLKPLKLVVNKNDYFFINDQVLSQDLNEINLKINLINDQALKKTKIASDLNFVFANHQIEFEKFPKQLIAWSITNKLANCLTKTKIVNMMKTVQTKQVTTFNHDNWHRTYCKLIQNLVKAKFIDGKYYRLKPVYIGNHQGANGADLEQLMDYLFTFINYDLISYDEQNNDLTNALLKIIISHFYYEYLHPYYDFNGRSGRILMDQIAKPNRKLQLTIRLMIWLISFQVIDYQTAFQISQIKDNGNLTWFCQTMLKFYLQALNFSLYLQKLQWKCCDQNHECFDLLTLIYIKNNQSVLQLKSRFIERFSRIIWNQDLDIMVSFKTSLDCLIAQNLVIKSNGKIKLCKL